MTDTNQASEDKQLGAVRTAISKDFETIYVKEFTTNWKIERLSRNLEIGVMDFDAMQALIRTEKLKLLAEVRERQIPVIALKAKKPHDEVQIQAVPIEALNKLEAEL